MINIRLEELRQINCGTTKKQLVRLLVVLPDSILISKDIIQADDAFLYGKGHSLRLTKQTQGGWDKYYDLLLKPIMEEEGFQKLIKDLAEININEQQVISIKEESFLKIPYSDILSLDFFRKKLFTEAYIKIVFKENISLPELIFAPCVMTPYWGVKNMFQKTKSLYKEIKSKIETN